MAPDGWFNLQRISPEQPSCSPPRATAARRLATLTGEAELRARHVLITVGRMQSKLFGEHVFDEVCLVFPRPRRPHPWLRRTTRHIVPGGGQPPVIHDTRVNHGFPEQI